MFKDKRVLVLLVVVALISSALGGMISRGKVFGVEVFDYIEIFSIALSEIQRNYVERVEVKDLVYGAIKGMVGTLDEYSEFMTPEVYREFTVDTRGAFGGLGIQIAVDPEDQMLTIIAPIEDTPAYRVGVKAGDKIMEIDGKPTKGMNTAEAVQILRGRPGTPVTITVKRDGKEVIPFVITRDIIRIKSIKDDAIINEEHKIGYVRLVEFRENVGEELEKALDKLEKQGMKALIFDLRNNPGGLLQSAIDVSSKFINEGEVIVTTRGRRQGNNVRGTSRGTTHPKYPLVILINKGSASASEIVAGAIQDHKRGSIVGEQSFGKGSVQTVLTLKDGSGMRITTAKWYTPGGNPIHGKGITPDVVVEAPKLTDEERGELIKLRDGNYIKAFLDKYPSPSEENISQLIGELKEKNINLSKELVVNQIRLQNSIKEDDALADVQLMKAIEILKGSRMNQQASSSG
jgi:carboxyl-terminal processing protease